MGLSFTPCGIVAFLSDFGYHDTYVAEVIGAILCVARGLNIVSITHDIPPGDVRAGGLALMRAAKAFPDGTVFLAVVDPQVGTSRRALVATTHSKVFVGPDNGLLSFAATGATWRVIEREELFRRPVSRTFHGRDIFGPVAAAVASGAITTEECGRIITDPIELSFPLGFSETGFARGEVISIDRFGNLLISVEANNIERLPSDGTTASITLGGRIFRAIWGPYASAGELVIHEDSSGFIEIAAPCDNAQAFTGAAVGDTIEVRWDV